MGRAAHGNAAGMLGRISQVPCEKLKEAGNRLFLLLVLLYQSRKLPFKFLKHGAQKPSNKQIAVKLLRYRLHIVRYFLPVQRPAVAADRGRVVPLMEVTRRPICRPVVFPVNRFKRL